MIEIFYLLSAAMGGWILAANLVWRWREEKRLIHLLEALYVAVGAAAFTVLAQTTVMRMVLGGR